MDVINALRQQGITSAYGLAEALNEQGITTPRGSRWHAIQVQWIIAKGMARAYLVTQKTPRNRLASHW